MRKRQGFYCYSQSTLYIPLTHKSIIKDYFPFFFRRGGGGVINEIMIGLYVVY